MGAPTGQLSFQVLTVAQGAGLANYSVQVESPLFALSTQPTTLVAPSKPSVQAGDTLRSTVTVQYDVNRLPFFLSKMEIKLVDPAGELVATAPAFVFFTPYNLITR